MKTFGYLFVCMCLFSCMQNNEPYKRPIVIAHRGASGIAPENTLVAIQKAMEFGADMIEIDVHYSKDKKVVVMHDHDVIRTTEGLEDIENLTLEELRQLEAGAWFSAAYAGEPIPLLEDVMSLMQGKKILLIEIKKGRNGRYEGLEQAVMDIVDAYKGRSWVVVQSFEAETVQKVREVAPDVEVHQLVMAAGGIGKYEGVTTITPYYRTLTHKFVRKAHEAKLKVFTYTVNSKREMTKCIKSGVDGIITNHPDQLIEILTEIEAAE